MSCHVFCREICHARGEPLAGTGAVTDRALLLRWPRGKWRVPRFEAAGMSADLGAAVKSAMDKGVHVALVDRLGETDDLPMLQAQPQGIAANFDSEAGLIAAINTYAAGGSFEGQSDLRTTILCCTDSRRDACCARFGFATFKALQAQADPSRFQLLQCTHIGGCRFAASLMVLPRRERYGRLMPEQVPAFLSSLAAGEPFLPAWRGRADLPEALQVAEIAALDWAEHQGIDRAALRMELDAVPDASRRDEKLTVSARAGHHRLLIHLTAREFTIQGNCDAVATERGQVKLRWCAERVEQCSQYAAE